MNAFLRRFLVGAEAMGLKPLSAEVSQFVGFIDSQFGSARCDLLEFVSHVLG